MKEMTLLSVPAGRRCDPPSQRWTRPASQGAPSSATPSPSQVAVRLVLAYGSSGTGKVCNARAIMQPAATQRGDVGSAATRMPPRKRVRGKVLIASQGSRPSQASQPPAPSMHLLEVVDAQDIEQPDEFQRKLFDVLDTLLAARGGYPNERARPLPKAATNGSTPPVDAAPPPPLSSPVVIVKELPLMATPQRAESVRNVLAGLARFVATVNRRSLLGTTDAAPPPPPGRPPAIFMFTCTIHDTHGDKIYLVQRFSDVFLQEAVLFRVPPATEAALLRRLRQVALAEGVSPSESMLSKIAAAANGDVRQAITQLQWYCLPLPRVGTMPRPGNEPTAAEVVSMHHHHHPGNISKVQVGVHSLCDAADRWYDERKANHRHEESIELVDSSFSVDSSSGGSRTELESDEGKALAAGPRGASKGTRGDPSPVATQDTDASPRDDYLDAPHACNRVLCGRYDGDDIMGRLTVGPRLIVDYVANNRLHWGISVGDGEAEDDNRGQAWAGRPPASAGFAARMTLTSRMLADCTLGIALGDRDFTQLAAMPTHASPSSFSSSLGSDLFRQGGHFAGHFNAFVKTFQRWRLTFRSFAAGEKSPGGGPSACPPPPLLYPFEAALAECKLARHRRRHREGLVSNGDERRPQQKANNNSRRAASLVDCRNELCPVFPWSFGCTSDFAEWGPSAASSYFQNSRQSTVRSSAAQGTPHRASPSPSAVPTVGTVPPTPVVGRTTKFIPPSKRTTATPPPPPPPPMPLRPLVSPEQLTLLSAFARSSPRCARSSPHDVCSDIEVAYDASLLALADVGFLSVRGPALPPNFITAPSTQGAPFSQRASATTLRRPACSGEENPLDPIEEC